MESRSGAARKIVEAQSGIENGVMEQYMAHTGGCLCAAVRYRIKGALRGVIACHCSQ